MRFARMRSRVSSSGAWRRTSSSKVAFASSIIAHSSPPLVSIPASANSSGSTWRSSLPSSGRPSESASRLAGSIVSTATFLPRAAIPAAIAAELVVLPTPPEPGADADALAVEELRDAGHQSIVRLASSRISSTPSSGSKTKGSVRTGAVDQLRQAGELLALRRGSAALAERRPARGAQGRRWPCRRRPLEPLQSRPSRSAPGRARSCRRDRPRRRPPRSAAARAPRSR